MKKFNLLILSIILVLVIACDDVLEENIGNDQISVLSPLEGAIIYGNSSQFSWQELEGADSYRIQILNENQGYILDSLITSTIFNYNISPGSYKWRVRGENFAYSTPYTFPLGFSVQESTDLSNQLIELVTPTVDFYTNNTDLIFTWNQITSSESYNFELVKNFNGMETILLETDFTENSMEINPSLMNEDSEYIWKVKAKNSISETEYSNRSVFIDRQVPNQPILSSPDDQFISSSTQLTFNWQNGIDEGNIQSEITNTIEISTDINFSTIVESNSTINNSSLLIFNDIGTYFWRVVSKDEAGNQSDYSIVRTFTIE